MSLNTFWKRRYERKVDEAFAVPGWVENPFDRLDAIGLASGMKSNQIMRDEFLRKLNGK